MMDWRRFDSVTRALGRRAVSRMSCSPVQEAGPDCLYESGTVLQRENVAREGARAASVIGGDTAVSDALATRSGTCAAVSFSMTSDRLVFTAGGEAEYSPAPSIDSAPTRPHYDATGSRGTLLSPREWEIAALLAQGKGNRDIAGDLVLSERTVHAHIRSIFAKLGFNSRSQVTIWGIQRGIASGPSVALTTQHNMSKDRTLSVVAGAAFGSASGRDVISVSGGTT
jgi:DNA-binding CsgD family transcriptional regulator